MDPTITKASTGNERLVAACAESQSTSRGPNRTRFLAVQAVIRAKMQCDKKTLLADADASKKRNLMLVGGHADNPVEVCGEGNADAKRPCLGKGQTMLTKPPSQAEFEECWSEALIKNGLSPSLVDDPLFRKALVTTARMGQSGVCMGKGTALGKRDTTLPRRDTFSRKIIPATDKRLDEEGMARLKPRMKKVGGTLMSDGWQSTSNKPVINVILGVDGMLTLRLAADCSCRREMDERIKQDIWSVMEDFSKAPGGKDFSKMKAQYAMFVDAVASKQVCVSICMTLHLRITLSNSTDNIVCTASF
jgi:hypothetical protein